MEKRQKVAVVVGAGSGIGLAISIALQALDWKVYEWDQDTGWFDDGVPPSRDPDEAGITVPHQVDVRWRDEVHAAALEVEEERIDAVIYAARPWVNRDSLINLSGEDWELAMDANAKGLLLVAQALRARLGDTRGRELAGTLVHVSRSEEGWATFPALSAASSVRAALATELMDSQCVTVFGLSLVTYEPDLSRAAELMAFLLSTKERHLALHSLDIPYGS